MAECFLPLQTPAAAAATTTTTTVAPRRSFLSPGTAVRPLLIDRSCPAATREDPGSLRPPHPPPGHQNGGLAIRRCSAVVPRASAVRISGLDEGETGVCCGSVNPIIVIDNYDSFTYNLCQYMGELGANFEVYRNDELTVEEMKRKKPRGILISPGPGTPQDSGISLQTVLELGPSTPLFGVCMGLQCIGEAFGGKIVRSPYGVMHGKSSLVYHDEKGEDGLFSGLPNPFPAGRYHSLVIENDSFPSDVLEITAWTEDGLIMAARHKTYMHIQGVQFHPESIITAEGRAMVQNFIKLIERFEAESRNNV